MDECMLTVQGYRWYSFWLEQLDALWQSVAIFFTAYFVSVCVSR
jgi:hypothetical protein